jgi:signal peptidase I
VATKQRSSAGGSLLELVLIVAVALGLALGIQAFLVKPYRIPSESMVPTLQIGQRVLVNRIGDRFSDPSVGDVLVFHPPAGAESMNECGGGPPPPRVRRARVRRASARTSTSSSGSSPGRATAWRSAAAT